MRIWTVAVRSVGSAHNDRWNGMSTSIQHMILTYDSPELKAQAPLSTPHLGPKTDAGSPCIEPRR
jgi:hypothetical protein